LGREAGWIGPPSSVPLIFWLSAKSVIIDAPDTVSLHHCRSYLKVR
jgi:hypothetical protein